MIIFLNLCLLISFLVKSSFQNNEFSLLKTTFKKSTKQFFIYLNFFKKNSLISFKKFIKLNLFFKKYLNKAFKEYMYVYFFINSLKNKASLLNLLSKGKIKDKQMNFKVKATKLNEFLKKNTESSLNKEVFLKNFKSSFSINHKPSSIVRLFSENSINLLFLRKNKIFNKGRYSRNRQLYRTGVYWCIWLSVFLGYCLYFSFYRFTFNFGYQWWLVFSFLFLFINQKMFKYNFYNLKIISLELKKFFNWLSLFFYQSYKYIIIFFKK